MELHVDNLQSFFPAVAENDLRNALQASGGDPDKAASLLLEKSSRQDIKPSTTKNPPKVIFTDQGWSVRASP